MGSVMLCEILSFDQMAIMRVSMSFRAGLHGRACVRVKLTEGFGTKINTT